MGARAHFDGRTLEIRGGELLAADLHGADLRAAGAMVVAALAAKGTSTVRGLDALDRGYVELVPRLRSLGAVVDRIDAEATDTRPSLEVRSTANSADRPSVQEGKRTVRA